MKKALTIAGSDSSGGAGIQADIKTMTMNGVYAMSAITAITAQNTTGVTGILEVSPDFLGKQLDAVFEEDFGRRGKFEPVTLEIGGQKVYVEGKIDRSDILDVGGQKRVRIIDYKTGSDSLNVWKMRNGYKMQLMIYMISASSGDLEPAGLFYFNIKDPIEGIDNKSAKAAAAVADRQPGDTYRLRGRFIDDPGVLEAMPAEMLTGGRSEKDRRISREDYESLRHDVLQRIEETAEGILKGDIGIHPFKDGGRLACTYCSYKPVCRRDREYSRNTAREIGPEPKEEKEQDN